MPPTSKRTLGPTRYRYEDVVKRIEAYLDLPENKGMRKRFEAACGMDHSSFSHRMSKYRGELFRVEHFGAMAEEARAPEPWPFADWKLAEAFQGFKKLFESGGHR